VAKALRASGFEIIIIAPYDHTSELLHAEGFQHLDIAIDNKGLTPQKDIRLLFNLYSIYRKLKPDLVIHYTIKPNIYGGFAAKLAQIKTISFITGLGSMFIKPNLLTKLIEIMYRISFSFSKRVWFLNEDDHKYFVARKIASYKTADVFPGEGIDTNVFLPDNKQSSKYCNTKTFKFLYLGRILKDKGILEMVAASKLLKQKYIHVECQLLGFIDALNPSAISAEQVQEWAEEGIIVYLGHTNEVRRYILGADCIVLPSYREGISRTLLEAASMGKPIITTDVTGCRDVVEDEITGLLCRVKDEKDLAGKMERMLKMTPEQRKEMGQLGRLKVIAQFDEKIIIQKYKDTIQQIL
jgi:glycosyltransferase involved in cell wall biosynthesis